LHHALSARVAGPPQIEEENLARKTVLVCDNCGNEIDESKGAVMRINFNDARRGSKQADLCDACAAKMPGQAAARRGRRPKAASAG
jgi:ribosomal protein S26